MPEWSNVQLLAMCKEMLDAYNAFADCKAPYRLEAELKKNFKTRLENVVKGAERKKDG